jgi:probable phosphoglycerate mutase
MWRDGCPNGETPEDVGRRADTFLLGLEGGPEVVVAFAHAHIIRIIAARAIGLEARRGEIFTLDTATVSVVHDLGGKCVLQHWNLRPTLIEFASTE